MRWPWQRQPRRQVERRAKDLSDDLTRHLYQTWFDMHPGERQRSHWVMSPQWWNEVRKLASNPMILPIWISDVGVKTELILMGKLVQLRDDGGVPHLEVDA